MLAMRLLQLQEEFSSFDQREAVLAEFSMKPERTREAIAAEYGERLAEFVRSLDPSPVTSGGEDEWGDDATGDGIEVDGI